MTPKLVIFDVDGTLVDSQHVIMRAMGSAFEAVDRPMPDRSEILSIVGLSLHEAFTRLAPLANDTELATLVSSYKDSFSQQRHTPNGEAPLYPGAKALLEKWTLRGDVILGIATGKSKRGVDFMIEKHGLTGMFATVQVADFHPSKPHPSMIEAAMAEAGADAPSTVMIGDTTFDMEMARSAGVAGIGVSWGYHPQTALLDAGAGVVVDDFAGLDSQLEGRFG